MEKHFKTRIQFKTDLEVNWLKATNFIPKKSELIIYDKEIDAEGNILELPEGRTTPYYTIRTKLGDGITSVNNLPFTSSGQNLINISWSDLVAMRNNGDLIPGLYYNIIDYNCVFSNDNARGVQATSLSIIVQAIANNAISELAQTNYLSSSFIINSEPSNITAAYQIMIDNTGSSQTDIASHIEDDVFVEIAYKPNNMGTIVPVIYKTDPEFYTNPDYEDAFYYVGTMEYDGQLYDKWQMINASDYTWTSTQKKYLLTNVVVESDPTQTTNLSSIAQVLYCLDNDSGRFGWADDSGKGVIYWMRDLYGNEAPYDFKNIQFYDSATQKWMFTFGNNSCDLTSDGHASNCKILSSFVEVDDGTYLLLPNKMCFKTVYNTCQLKDIRVYAHYIDIQMTNTWYENIEIYADIDKKPALLSNAVYRPTTYTEVIVD